MGTFCPLSSTRPGPTASTMPSWGFSLAVSGRTMPLFVLSSRSTGLRRTRSPRGLTFMCITSCLKSLATEDILQQERHRGARQASPPTCLVARPEVIVVLGGELGVGDERRVPAGAQRHDT